MKVELLFDPVSETTMTQNNNQEPTIGDVLEAVNEASTKTEKRLQKIEGDLTTVKEDLHTVKEDLISVKEDLMSVKEDLISVKEDLISVKEDLISVKSTMVTKDFLEDKLADLKGDIIVTIRGEDRKLAALIDILRTRQVISNEEAKLVLSMKPFPELSVG